MAWNRPESGKAESFPLGKKERSSILNRKGFRFSALAIAIVAIVGVWWLWPSEEAETQQDVAPKDRTLIKEAAPAHAPVNVVAEVVKTNDAPPGYVRSSTGVLHPAGIPYKKEWKHAHTVHTNDPSRFARSKSTAPAPFRNATEQALHRIFSRPLGMAPLPPIKLSKAELDDIVNILVTPNHPTKEDDERSAAARKNIDLAKKEMAKFIADGGRPQEFLDHYWRENEKAYALRREAMDQLEDFRKNESDAELCEELKKKLNEHLAEKGIIPINN